jgi:uncharacterized protein YqjF (DUF2071 family)
MTGPKVLDLITDPDLSVDPPSQIRRPMMVHTWRNLAFLHWPFEPELIQALLPRSLEVDCFAGAAWVGLIPFYLAVRFPSWLPSMPGLSRTLEINVRTYVRGPDGRRGIWFLSLDAACLPVVLTSRAWYRIPYMWADVRFQRDSTTIRYEGRRRIPRHRNASFRIRLSLETTVDDLSALEQFLTCRWRLYSPSRRGVMASKIEHPRWPLVRAHPIDVESGLLTQLGLEEPSDPPLALFSPEVNVKWDRRQRLPAR